MIKRVDDLSSLLPQSVRCTRSTKGGVTILVLVMLLVFVIIFGSLIRYIARQSNLTVNQGQEEQSFGLADTGVQYVLWLLGPNPNPTGSNGGGQTPQDICTADLSDLLQDHEVTDGSQGIGLFTIEPLTADATSIRIRSTGRDANRPDICQVVEADIRQAPDNLYHVVSWNHLLGYPCGTPAPACVYN